MDGRASALLAFGLALACGGCVTSQQTKSVAVRRADEPAPAPVVAKKDEPKKQASPKLMLALAELKERQAETAKDQPDAQAKLRDEARQVYQDLLKAYPDHLEAYRGLGNVYTRMGDYERALDTYQKALTKHPKDVVLWHDLGMLHNRRKNWAEGARCLTKALEIDPENQRCLKTLGFTLARAGQADQSVPYLTRAIGSAAAAHHQVAKMLLHLAENEQSGQRAQLHDQARRHLRVAVRENPNLSQARELLADLTGQAPDGVRQASLQFEPGK